MNGVTKNQGNPGALVNTPENVEYLEQTTVDSDKTADLRLAPAALATRPPVKGGSIKPPVNKGGSGKPPVNTGGGIKPPVIKEGVKPPVIKDGGKPPVTKGGAGRPPAHQPKRPPVKPASGQVVKPLAADSLPVVAPPSSRFDRLLSIINTTTGVLDLIHPLNSVFNADGTVTWPGGSVVDAQGQTVKHPDGSKQSLDGTTVHADGTIEHADGSLEYKDGTWKLADGTVKYPDGRWLHPDGTLTDAEGNVLGMVKLG